MDPQSRGLGFGLELGIRIDGQGAAGGRLDCSATLLQNVRQLMQESFFSRLAAEVGRSFRQEDSPTDRRRLRLQFIRFGALVQADVGERGTQPGFHLVA